MKTSFVSTRAISESNRLAVSRTQSRLLIAQKEVASGRLADVGKSIGHRAGQAVFLRQENTRLSTLIDTNVEVTTRVELTQAALRQLVDGAQNLLGQLLGARNNETGPAVVQRQAQANLQSLIDTLNSTFNGKHLFAGINTDVKPITDYFETPPPANRQAVANAFITAFGIPQSDPSVNAITAANIQAFLDGPLAALFDIPAFTADWSAASDQNLRSRISTRELVETSTNANEQAIRSLAKAYTIVADLGVENLNTAAYQAVVDTAVSTLGEAIQGISQLQAQLGTVQEQVATANERISIQIDTLTRHISVLESVDAFEASTRITTLTTQLETAYSLTARIQRLSLLNYL